MAQELKTLPFAVATHACRYDGRVALVTGAAQGLGRVTARQLAEEGAKVAVADVQAERVKLTSDQLREETGQPFLHFTGDLSKEGVADEVVGKTIAEFGQLDTLVNNAAALIRLKLVDFTEELMQQAVA